MQQQPKPRIRVLLDSGAFSAWRQDQAVNRDDYIRFVRAVEPCVWRCVNLDVIPGGPGRDRWPEVEAAAKQSYENLQRMKDAGLRPIPVFHQGEDFRWLEKMIKDGEDTIGLSTAKNWSFRRMQCRWLDDVFARLTDRTGTPLVRVHAFGSARVGVLRRHPFASADSAGWAITAANGKLYCPPYRDGQPHWAGDPVMITMSGRPQQSKHAEDRQFDKLDAHEQDIVRRFLEQEVGGSLDLMRHNAKHRQRAMVVYCLSTAQAVAPHLTFFFATKYDRAQSQILLAAGATNHLLSFWDLRKRSPDVLVRYALEGGM